VSTPKTLKVLAPLSGVVVELDAVPDPVFAQRLVGDGASIDPTSGEVLAPVSGKITQLHDSKHAFTVCTDDGVEILTHVGVDTVTLRGAGFTALQKAGTRVQAGQPVLRFDLDQVACAARSLLTQVLIANQERIAYMRIAPGTVSAGKDVLLEVNLKAAATETPLSSLQGHEPVLSAEITLRNALGLHARPSAVLALRAKEFRSDVRLLRGTDEANAKSMTAVLGLSTSFGELVRIRAQGPDAAEAVKVLSHLIHEGCGEAPADAPAPIPVAGPSRRQSQSVVAGELAGETASGGLAIGTLVQLKDDHFDVPAEGGDLAEEARRLNAALREAALQLNEAATGEHERSKILAAHKELLEDPELQGAASDGLEAGQSAAYAWRAAYLAQASVLERLDNPALRERAVDIRDLGKRVLRLLVGAESKRPEVPDNAIIVAEEFTPSDVAGLDRAKVRGLCMVHGGVTGHVAILAKAMGMPALCGMDASVLALGAGRTVILDADKGLLYHAPDDVALASAKARLTELQARRAADIAAAAAPAVTTDGAQIEIAANVQNAEDIREALTLGAEGVGLLRSEFLFEGRATAPDEQEHLAAYLAAARALGKGKNLVIRTFDVGGDKPLAYLPMPQEANPFLGMRGIRVSLSHLELFRTQLRGILGASHESELHIMFPMVSSLAEFRKAKAVLQEEMQALGRTAKVGLMIEVPSAALLAERFAREADFFSIGTNDLTQYTLAMDRGHAGLAKAADTLEPSVLKMIAMTVEGAHAHGKWVGVCGGVASDPAAIPLLVGLGVDELSVSPPSIPAVKAQVRGLSRAGCAALAARALAMDSAAEVRAAVSTLNK
jgi:phosphocarrier protein FPr/phosphocarrier protein